MGTVGGGWPPCAQAVTVEVRCWRCWADLWPAGGRSPATLVGLVQLSQDRGGMVYTPLSPQRTGSQRRRYSTAS